MAIVKENLIQKLRQENNSNIYELRQLYKDLKNCIIIYESLNQVIQRYKRQIDESADLDDKIAIKSRLNFTKNKAKKYKKEICTKHQEYCELRNFVIEIERRILTLSGNYIKNKENVSPYRRYLAKKIFSKDSNLVRRAIDQRLKS